MSKFILSILGLILAFTSSAETIKFNSGTKQTTMIELFTSQGCSSCPAAEEWINQLVESPRLWNELIPLAFHVDYWDGLGWRDIYAKEEYSSRQYLYKHDGNVNVVYTPGFLVNGQEWRGWRNSSIPFAKKQVGTLSIKIQRQGLSAEYKGDNKQLLQFHVAILGFNIKTSVEAGENQGRNLEQQFLVLAHNQTRSTQNIWQTKLPEVGRSASKYGFVAWVSSLDNQKPIQATGGWLPNDFVQ
jgi:hypothetical protein